MSLSPLSLIIGPDPIFRKKAQSVENVDENVVAKAKGLRDLLKREKGVGIGANMAGLLDRIIVVDLPGSDVMMPLYMINPEITEKSEETQSYEEASLSFPGVSAEIKRPAKITVHYLDLNAEQQNLTAIGFLATVIQHEVDYLDGVLFFDHLSKLKRDALLRKYKKLRKVDG
ncbi:MAG: peptide deformylase [Sneathiella sp.]|nr:peptide deformylase [Sneathiella sp.]